MWTFWGNFDNNIGSLIWCPRKISWSTLLYKKNNENIRCKDDILMLIFIVRLCGDFIKIQKSLQLIMDDALPTPWGTQMWIPNWKQRKGKESGHTSWFAALERGRKACWSFGMGLGIMTSNLVTDSNLHQTNQHVG
jgi:hypothetical protein